MNLYLPIWTWHILFSLLLKVYFIDNTSRLFCVLILTAWCVVVGVCKYIVYYESEAVS